MTYTLHLKDSLRTIVYFEPIVYPIIYKPHYSIACVEYDECLLFFGNVYFMVYKKIAYFLKAPHSQRSESIAILP